jgi:G3E family GTPase
MIVAAAPQPPLSAPVTGHPEPKPRNAAHAHDHHHHDHHHHDHGHAHSVDEHAHDGVNLHAKSRRNSRSWLALSAHQRLVIVLPGIGLLWLATLWAMGWIT